MQTKAITADENVWNLLTLLARRAGITEDQAIANLILEDHRRRSQQNDDLRTEARRAEYAQDPPDTTTLPVADPYLDYVLQRPRVEQDPDWRP